MEEQEEFR